jgi:hypothetical protein
VARTPFDATEPPNGDFARYIEKLEQQAAAAPVSASPASVARPAAAQPTPTGPLPTAARAGGARLDWRPAANSSTQGKPPLRRRGSTTPGAFPINRAAWWLIGAGAALILLAVLPDDPMIETPLPGIVLIGAGLAIRKHFAKNGNSG